MWTINIKESQECKCTTIKINCFSSIKIKSLTFYTEEGEEGRNELHNKALGNENGLNTDQHHLQFRILKLPGE